MSQNSYAYRDVSRVYGKVASGSCLAGYFLRGVSGVSFFSSFFHVNDDPRFAKIAPPHLTKVADICSFLKRYAFVLRTPTAENDQYDVRRRSEFHSQSTFLIFDCSPKHENCY